MQAVTVVGIDCAVAPERVGLALGRVAGGRTRLLQACRASRSEPPVEIAVRWIRAAEPPVLLALDAPLGWPAPLGERLAAHRAGEALEGEANVLFRRATDVFVKQRLGKQPLDVGADRIARTAHAALGLLSALRHRLNHPIPLAWHPAFDGLAVIEVYPAATLKAYGISSRGYKRKAAVRHRMLEALRPVMMLSETDTLGTSDHTLDAALCVLAAGDFLEGRAYAPPESKSGLAHREGWIWIRDPRTTPEAID